MKTSLSTLFLHCLFSSLFSAIVFAGVARGADVDRLIGDLASESYKVREAATRGLWKIGDEAIPALREASRSEDPERAHRASDVLEKVELRITPETSDRILSLIDLYRESAINEKIKLLADLKRQNAYYQLLKLFSMESPENRIALRRSIAGVAMMGASEAIAQDDAESAIELLRMSAGDHRDLIALASVYRTHGLLEEELKNPIPPADVPKVVWEMSLLRVKGDIESAEKLALKSKQFQLLAALKVLSGDPVPWIRRNGLEDGRLRARDAYVEIALKRWSGENVGQDDYAPLYQLLESKDENSRGHAMTSLASLGQLDRIEKVQAKQSPAAGFEYYVSRENVDDALRAIGLKPEAPDYKSWVAERFRLMNGEFPDGRNEWLSADSELLMLAGFMERRGLREELDQAFSEALSKFTEQDQDAFVEFLGELLNNPFGAPRFASDQAEKWAGDDEGRWKEILAVAFEDDEDVSWVLERIREIEPEAAEREILDAMLALFNKSGSPGGLRGEWMDRIWKSISETEKPALKLAEVKRVLSFSINQSDGQNVLKAWDMLTPDEQASVARTASIDRFLSAAERWEEAAEIFESSKFSNSSSPELHAYLAANLRRAGFEERAREHDEWAEKLALGYSPVCNRIGGYYAYAGDQKRAHEWYRRAVLLADVGEGEFLGVLDSYANSMFSDENWQVAASCFEVLVHVYASQDYVPGAIGAFAKERLNADLAKAMAILPEDKERALAILEGIHHNFAADGVLADHFFPLLRKAGLEKELERWFGASWEHIVSVIRKYPESHNTRNTAAWFASRAVMKLDEAEQFLKGALEQSPNQPAYLDTMAEIKFAQGDRKKAMEWSSRAVSFSPLDDMIRQQNDRFRNEKLPQE